MKGVVGDFIKWFSELDKNSVSVAGGKGANLAEIYNLKIQVPPGFVITAQAYDYFIEKSNLKEKISELLKKINYEDTKQLDEITKVLKRNQGVTIGRDTTLREQVISLGYDYDTMSAQYSDEEIKQSLGL